MPSPLSFLAAVPKIASGIATGAGIIGTLFGSGTKSVIPDELREVYELLLGRAKEGISDEGVAKMLELLKTGVGEEAGALSALTENRLTKAGAGVGVKQTARDRINRNRLRSIGEGTTRIGIADEEAKGQAFRLLTLLQPEFRAGLSDTGGGFAKLLESGLGYLFNEPGGGGNQPGGAGTGGAGTPNFPDLDFSGGLDFLTKNFGQNVGANKKRNPYRPRFGTRP